MNLLCRKLADLWLEDHEVVGQHADIGLAVARDFVASCQARAQPPLELADGTLNVPALARLLLGKLSLHLQPVRSAGQRPGPPTVVYRNHRVGDAQLFPTEPMMGLRVVGGVSIQCVNAQAPHRLAHKRRQKRRLVSRAGPRQSCREHMAAVLAEHREPWKGRSALCAPFAAQEIGADVSALQPRGVHRGLGVLRDQTQLGGALASSVEQWRPKPLFSKRCWAF